jgi:hypothetical protein
MMGTLSFNRVHTQLRRLKNNSSVLSQAAVSSLDPSKSLVFFTFAMDPMYQLQVRVHSLYAPTFIVGQ